MSHIEAKATITSLNILKYGAIGFGLLGTGAGFSCLASPSNALNSFGLPPPAPSSQPLVQALGARNLGTGIGLLVLAYNAQWKAIGLLLCSGTITALVDAWVVLNNGDRKTGYGHAGGAVIFGAIGAGLLSYYP